MSIPRIRLSNVQLQTRRREMNTGDVQSLFQSAQEEGLSIEAAGILVNNLNGVTVAGAAGAQVDDLAGDEATLYVRIIDKTGSMKRFTQNVIDAGNEQIQALERSKASDSILMSTWVFNETSTLLHSYQPLATVVQLDRNNYDPDGMTALYDAVLDGITSAVAYTQTLRDAGIRVKVVIVIVSDGEDNTSSHTVAQVRTVIKNLLRQEIYTVAFVAFGTEGTRIADEMGIPQQNVLDEKADAHAIRSAFDTVSKSVIRASQTTIGQQSSQSFFN
ncbi:hypothetical protein HY469_01135 [Candidatus Roizmanbacteria bacterium]|nr:hypothetical protein [Candidatus Roizmanbacteria bacterium]